MYVVIVFVILIEFFSLKNYVALNIPNKVTGMVAKHLSCQLNYEA